MCTSKNHSKKKTALDLWAEANHIASKALSDISPMAIEQLRPSQVRFIVQVKLDLAIPNNPFNVADHNPVTLEPRGGWVKP